MAGGGSGKVKVKETDAKAHGVFYYSSECFLFTITKFMKHHVFSPAKDVLIPQHFDSKFKRLLPIFGVSLNDKNLTNGDGTNKHTIIVNRLESIKFFKNPDSTFSM